ncbi:hypothetical protein FBEOM_909 [Fusarium beomiforme]|uniref:Uncharacterized protein n=1 Tax=Fusarium beomiforme TaxID=44412 RepID=A0A9P5AU72_9HYPO|nr:hypothetical protein FBEOM_909 [Fusarium beomiforme]
MASTSARPSASSAVRPTIETQSNAPSAPGPSHQCHSTPTSVAATANPETDFEVPTWLRDHMTSWKIPPTPVRARAWVLEAFDHFNSARPLPTHLDGIKSQLRRAWMRETKKRENISKSRIKRKSDANTSQAAAKRTKASTSVKTEENTQVAMPPPKPLGNLKGNPLPGDGETLRGYLAMGRMMTYRALMLFDKRPTEASDREVPFRWRGRKMSNGVREFRGDKNCGWMKFLGDGKIEVYFKKLNLRLEAQKGRGIGERQKHNAAVFWDDWHELDEGNLDLLDIDRLMPPDW